MVYVRHRPRMVRQSIYEDLIATLADLNWLGATPLGLLRDEPLQVIDFFPEGAVLQNEGIAPNTLAMDAGRPGELALAELGGIRYEQPYLFNFALYADTDGVALALFSDMHDRYMGWSGYGDSVPLYNFNQATPTVVVNMEVDGFRWAKAADQVVPDIQVYFAELWLIDHLEMT